MASIRVVFAVLVTACVLVDVLGSHPDKWNKKYNKERYQEPQKSGDRRESESRWSNTESETYLRDDESWSGKQQVRSRRDEPSSSQHWQHDQEPQRRGAQKTRNPADTRRKEDVSKNTRPQSEQNVDVNEYPQCERHAYDPRKLAKCERKAREQQEPQLEQITSPFPVCQKYVVDPYKLSICETKAAEMGIPKVEAAVNPIEGEVEAKSYPDHCERYAHDSYKLAKCERKARDIHQYVNKFSSTSQIEFPECQRYASDPFKLSICKEKAQELSQIQSDTSSPNQKKQSSYPHCEGYFYDLYKLATCERKAAEFAEFQKDYPPLSENEKVEQNPAFAHCQKYAYDPFKQAKCESKARYWISIVEAQPAGRSGEEQTTIHPQCQIFAYDPYKLAKCEHKIKKYSNSKF